MFRVHPPITAPRFTLQKFLASLSPDGRTAGMPGQPPSSPAAVASAYANAVGACATGQAEVPGGRQ